MPLPAIRRKGAKAAADSNGTPIRPIEPHPLFTAAVGPGHLEPRIISHTGNVTDRLVVVRIAPSPIR
jgi:hypothetical protein